MKVSKTDLATGHLSQQRNTNASIDQSILSHDLLPTVTVPLEVPAALSGRITGLQRPVTSSEADGHFGVYTCRSPGNKVFWARSQQARSRPRIFPVLVQWPAIHSLACRYDVSSPSPSCSSTPSPPRVQNGTQPSLFSTDKEGSGVFSKKPVCTLTTIPILRSSPTPPFMISGGSKCFWTM